MRRQPARRALFAACAALVSFVGPVAAQPAPAPTPPKLIVTLVVDQLGANLFNQHRPAFTGGLKTLAEDGLVYANGYQTHGVTETCPGHSTVLTGMHPNRTGIPANDYVDRATGAVVYCLAAPQNRLADGGKGDNGPVGPDALRVSGLADWLKSASPRSRVFSVAGKDRGAVSLAGSRPDGAYWFTNGFGFTTYLRPGETAQARLQPLAAFNAGLLARWKATPPSWTYRRPECRLLAQDWKIGPGTFRSTLPPEDLRIDVSPLLDEVTLEAAEVLLTEQKLGRGPAPDLLTVSLSATDRIGHRYGAQGPEMCEHLHRMDAALGRFLDKVKQVPGGALVVLTADHGGSDFPERLAARGYPEAGRSPPDLLTRLNAALRSRFALTADPLLADGASLYVVGADRRGLPDPLRGRVAEAAVELLRQEPSVAGAFTLETLLATPAPGRDANPEELTLQQRFALSAVPGRSPDVILAFQPGITPGPARVGGSIAGHGTPWDYDRRVPIVFWWPGAEGQERPLPIRTIDIGPTLANAVGLRAPADLDGRCLDLGAFGAPACPREPARR